VKSCAKVRSAAFCWLREDHQHEALPAKWLGRVENSDHEISSVEINYRKKKLIGYFCDIYMRILEPYKNYFWDFYNPLKQNVKDKIDYVLQIVISVQRVPTKFFKHLEDGIYEIRIEVGSNIYRIFAFFDDNKLVVLLHGFQKKTQKTPRKEIERAKKLRKDYYDDKESKNDK
jgi:putative addiction module killer protein